MINLWFEATYALHSETFYLSEGKLKTSVCWAQQSSSFTTLSLNRIKSLRGSIISCVLVDPNTGHLPLISEAQKFLFPLNLCIVTKIQLASQSSFHNHMLKAI